MVWMELAILVRCFLVVDILNAGDVEIAVRLVLSMEASSAGPSGHLLYKLDVGTTPSALSADGFTCTAVPRRCRNYTTRCRRARAIARSVRAFGRHPYPGRQPPDHHALVVRAAPVVHQALECTAARAFKGRLKRPIALFIGALPTPAYAERS